MIKQRVVRTGLLKNFISGVGVWLSFFRSRATAGFGLHGHGFFLVGGGLAMGFVLPRPQRIQPLAEPRFFGPGPVTIRVGVELRRFHGDLRMGEQSPCHISYVKIPNDFSEVTGMPERKSLLTAKF